MLYPSELQAHALFSKSCRYSLLLSHSWGHRQALLDHLLNGLQPLFDSFRCGNAALAPPRNQDLQYCDLHIPVSWRLLGAQFVSVAAGLFLPNRVHGRNHRESLNHPQYRDADGSSPSTGASLARPAIRSSHWANQACARDRSRPPASGPARTCASVREPGANPACLGSGSFQCLPGPTSPT